MDNRQKGVARPLTKLTVRDTRIATLKRELRREQQLRREAEAKAQAAEANAKAFHAMLLKERIERL